MHSRNVEGESLIGASIHQLFSTAIEVMEDGDKVEVILIVFCWRLTVSSVLD